MTAPVQNTGNSEGNKPDAGPLKEKLPNASTNGSLSPLAWGFVVTLITVCMCLILLLYFICLTMTDSGGSDMHKVSARGHLELDEIESDSEAKISERDHGSRGIAAKTIGLAKVKKN